MRKFHLNFILDRSGSMSGLEEDTVGGYNGFLKKYLTYENTKVSTILFDHAFTLLYDDIPIAHAALHPQDYIPRGTTALLDAVGHTIQLNRAKKVFREIDEKIIYIITTDGEENASQDYNHQTLHACIQEEQKEGHEFVFLGANIDVGKEARKLGIKREFQASYDSTKQGTKDMYQTMDKMVKSMMEEK